MTNSELETFIELRVQEFIKNIFEYPGSFVRVPITEHPDPTKLEASLRLREEVCKRAHTALKLMGIEAKNHGAAIQIPDNLPNLMEQVKTERQRYKP